MTRQRRSNAELIAEARGDANIAPPAPADPFAGIEMAGQRSRALAPPSAREFLGSNRDYPASRFGARPLPDISPQADELVRLARSNPNAPLSLGDVFTETAPDFLPGDGFMPRGGPEERDPLSPFAFEPADAPYDPAPFNIEEDWRSSGASRVLHGFRGSEDAPREVPYYIARPEVRPRSPSAPVSAPSMASRQPLAPPTQDDLDWREAHEIYARTEAGRPRPAGVLGALAQPVVNAVSDPEARARGPEQWLDNARAFFGGGGESTNPNLPASPSIAWDEILPRTRANIREGVDPGVAFLPAVADVVGDWWNDPDNEFSRPAQMGRGLVDVGVDDDYLVGGYVPDFLRGLAYPWLPETEEARQGLNWERARMEARSNNGDGAQAFDASARNAYAGQVGAAGIDAALAIAAPEALGPSSIRNIGLRGIEAVDDGVSYARAARTTADAPMSFPGAPGPRGDVIDAEFEDLPAPARELADDPLQAERIDPLEPIMTRADGRPLYGMGPDGRIGAVAAGAGVGAGGGFALEELFGDEAYADDGAEDEGGAPILPILGAGAGALLGANRLRSRVSMFDAELPPPLAGQRASDMAQQIKEARQTASRAPQTLSQWARRYGERRGERGQVIQRGGIGDDRGDLAALDDTSRGFARITNRRSGQPLDYAATAANEQGFIPDADTNTLIDALADDIRGAHVIAASDTAIAEERAAAQQFLSELESLGVDINRRGPSLVEELRRNGALVATVTAGAGAGAAGGAILFGDEAEAGDGEGDADGFPLGPVALTTALGAAGAARLFGRGGQQFAREAESSVGMAGARPAPQRRFQAAVRDPETGEVYTGLDHIEAIDGVSDPAARARLQSAYDADAAQANPDFGFVVDGQYMGREDGLASMRPEAQGRQRVNEQRGEQPGGEARTDGLQVPEDPSEWRVMIGQHPWINSPARAQFIIMDNARLPDGTLRFSVDDIANATGYARESINAQRQLARQAGVPMREAQPGLPRDRPRGGNNLPRILDAMEQAERNGERLTASQIAQRVGSTIPSVRSILSQLRKGSAGTPELRERLAALEAARASQAAPNPGSGADPAWRGSNARSNLQQRNRDSSDPLAGIAIGATGAGALALGYADDAEADIEDIPIPDWMTGEEEDDDGDVSGLSGIAGPMAYLGARYGLRRASPLLREAAPFVAGGAAGAATEAATGNDPLAGVYLGTLASAAPAAAWQGVTRLGNRLYDTIPLPTDRPFRPDTIMTPEPINEARGRQVREMVLRGESELPPVLPARATPYPQISTPPALPPPPEPRLVGGRTLDERLEVPEGKKGGPETHLRGLNAGELRRAGQILGVEVGKSARASVSALASAIRNNPDAVRLLRDAGLAAMIGGILAADAARSGDAEAAFTGLEEMPLYAR